VRAVVYSGYGVTPELIEVADPACPADGVVIAVGATGVCRSDWHAWKGHDPVAGRRPSDGSVRVRLRHVDLVIAREIEIYGSHGMAARDYPAMMRLIADGTLRPGLLVCDVIALEDTGRALAAMSKVNATAGITVVRLAV
jgi:D-arabinose 1-dehydrogenase-like Zn-dependent alcohol dehydrogenase